MKKINVLVIDDSALMRKIISDMINSEADMEAIGTCRNGQELLNKINNTNVDIITLDLEMPIMDGITALRELKKMGVNIPVIVLSSVGNKAAKLTMDCLEAGAFDFLSKPSGTISLDISKIKDELITKIRAAYSNETHIIKHEEYNEISHVSKKAYDTKNKLIDAVLIGASTGGPKALSTVLTALPANLNLPVFVVQHMPAGFTKAFAERLNDNCDLTVVEAKDCEYIHDNYIYIAPGGYHMEVGSDKKIHLNTEPQIWGVRPAVDKLFMSAVKVYNKHLISVILTGMGKDGAQGTAAVKEAGGVTIAEDKSTCTIYGMPKAAYETGKVDLVLPINDIPIHITKIILGSRR